MIIHINIETDIAINNLLRLLGIIGDKNPSNIICEYLFKFIILNKTSVQNNITEKYNKIYKDIEKDKNEKIASKKKTEKSIAEIEALPNEKRLILSRPFNELKRLLTDLDHEIQEIERLSDKYQNEYNMILKSFEGLESRYG